MSAAATWSASSTKPSASWPKRSHLPEGVHFEWSGEFEHQVRAARTLRFVFPAVIVLIFVILYLTYNDLADAALMMLAVPEALAGGAFFMYLFPKIMQGWSTPPMDFSVAVWVGFIACFGMATETGIIMLVYLREAIDKRGGLENIKSLEELRQAVIEGAVHRLRPKLLTEGVAIIAIFPMVFAKGVGGEILAPMALPVLGRPVDFRRSRRSVFAGPLLLGAPCALVKASRREKSCGRIAVRRGNRIGRTEPFSRCRCLNLTAELQVAWTEWASRRATLLRRIRRLGKDCRLSPHVRVFYEQKQHDDWSLGTNAVRQLRRHVNPCSGAGGKSIGSQGYICLTAQEMHDGWRRGGVLRKLLSGAEAKYDDL